MSVNFDMKIGVEKRMTLDGDKTVSFRFDMLEGTQRYTKNVDMKLLQNEKQRDAILRNIAREVTDEMIIPKLVHTILNALVTSALQGNNPLE